MKSRAHSARAGHLVLEMLVAMGMLSLVLGLVFMTFRTTTRLFGEGTLRQSSEQQLNAIRVLLDRDTELSSFWQAQVKPRSVAIGESRDGLSLVALSDWNNPSLFQTGTFRPAWDRQVIWYATMTSPGRLVRQLDAPPPVSPATYLNKPYALLTDNFPDSAIASSSAALSVRYLSDDVRSFQVTTDWRNATLSIDLYLHKTGNLRARTPERVENNLHVIWKFFPKNTWPPL